MPSLGTTNSNALKRIVDRITCRRILSIMVILGYMVNYMLRVNLSLAIVEMIDDPTFQKNVTENATTANGDQKLQWNAYQKGQVLGSFFWGYLLTQLPGGRLSEVIGARLVYGGGILISSILTLLTPVACESSYMLAAILRAILGFFLGATFPAAPSIAAKWVPPLERSKFMSNMVATSLGAAFSMPLCASCITLWGWRSVYYITGMICLVWSVAWFLLVYDSPAKHPRISPEEKEQIETKIMDSCDVGTKPKRIPWLAILTSVPVWANVLSTGCGTFCYQVVLVQLPTYMKEVLRFDIEANGILSSLPYLANYTMAVLSGYLADHLAASKRFSTISVRKFFVILSLFGPGLLMALQALFGYIPTLSVAIFTGALFFRGSITGGHLANGLDLAPNFSGTILAMGNTIGCLGGWLSTIMVAGMTSENNSFVQWRHIFWIMFVINTSGAVIFLVIGSATLQPWNSEKPNIELDKQVQKWNTTKNEVLD